MSRKADECKEYMKKSAMLGCRAFDVEVDEYTGNVYVMKYIPNSEEERIIKVPDFVDRFVGEGIFEGTKQRIVLMGGANLKAITFDHYEGEWIDMRNIDTSKLVYMAYMFEECRNIEEIDLSYFNTSKVTDMGLMFYRCNKLTKLDFSTFDTSNVEHMHYMFCDCYNLKELDLSYFNTSKLKLAHGMFKGCDRLEKLDLSNFDTRRLKYREDMFKGCDSLKLIITNKQTKKWLKRHRKEISLPEDCEIQVGRW